MLYKDNYIHKTPHRPHRAVPLRDWQPDNRTSAAVLPTPRGAQKEDLARPHPSGPEALRRPGGPAAYCYFHRRDWSVHLTNEKIQGQRIHKQENNK